MTPRQNLSPVAIGLMIMCCLSWGFQQPAVKLALPEVPPLLQATLRSLVAAAVVLGYAWATRRDLDVRDGTLWPGVVAGLIFAAEFALLYGALTLTDASRAIMLLFVAPFVVALAGPWLPVPERLSLDRWAGILLAFLGLALLLEPWRAAPGARLAGDLLALAAGVLWGLNTLAVKATALRRAEPAKVLIYQLVVSALLLPLVSVGLGERLILPEQPITWAMLAYQGLWVVGITYLIWFWMLRAYPAGKLAVFTFLTPVFGALAGWLVLGEPLGPTVWVALVMVAAGIAVVSRPQRAAV